VLFASLSDLGIGNAAITFISRSLVKKNYPKARSYFKILLKYKIYFAILASLILLALAYYISKVYYNKPIFFALLAGAIYIPVICLLGFFESVFKASNNFKYPLFKELIFQVLRICLVPLSILLILKARFSNEITIMTIILVLVFCYSISLLFLEFSSKKKIDYMKYHSKQLSKIERKHLWLFILPLTATSFSGLFFGYIDTLMLGHFVKEEFIGYYSSALNLIGAAASMMGFISMAIFPIFSRLKGKTLESVFKKIFLVNLLISLLGAIFAFFLASPIIKIAYGSHYLLAVPLLKFFSILMIILPLTATYETYLISQAKTKTLAWLLICATILNIILNYFFITFGLKHSMLWAITGSCIAVILSRAIYLISLIISKKRLFPKSKNIKSN
jgi:O-antigen/teichoic acid export membrane protein